MNKVTDKSNSKSYFNQVPQIVWALSRSPQDYTLWNVIYMIAGEDGECYLGTEDLAELAMMSVGKVSDCREYLLAVGLLEGERKKVNGSQNTVWHLSIPDIWEENMRWRKTIDSLKDRVKFKSYIREALKKADSLRSFDKSKFLDSIELKLFNAKNLYNMKKSDYEGPISQYEIGYEGPISQYETKNNQEEEPTHVPEEEKPSSGTDLDDFFPREEESPLPNGKKELTPFDVLMAGRVGEGSKEVQAERDLKDSGWDIRLRAVRQAVVLFLAYSQFNEPPASDAHRKRWFKALREMSEEFSADEMRVLIPKANRRYKDKEFTVTGPEAYTKLMMGLKAGGEHKLEQKVLRTDDGGYYL